MTLDVSPVSSPRDLEAFLRLPWSIYKDEKTFVPPLLSADRKLLDRDRNPFWKFASAEHYLARRDGRVVGRISAIHNPRHLEYHGERCGFFGFLETEENPETARALLGAAESWTRARGNATIRGPVNPSTNDPCGMLVEGFKWPPFVMMTMNPPWYPSLVEAAGYAKAMDLLAYIIPTSDVVRDKIERVAATVRERGRVKIRPVRLDRFEEELSTVIDLYNDAWSRNWGFIPLTPEEIRFLASDLKSILLPELVVIAELDGEPAGFALALPDVNHVLKRCNGSLFPLGWLGFLRFNLRRIPTIRLVALGVRKALQNSGIGTLFYDYYVRLGTERGYKAAELSWILETNDLMNRPLVQMGAKVYKRYRIYDKAL